MKCPRCNGKRCEPDNSGSLVWRACKMCNGSGIVPDNNENWFCSLPTEEKAKVLGQIAKNAYQCCENGKTNKCVNRHNCNGFCDYGWEKWLKEKHDAE